MEYPIRVLEHHRRDLIATANALELKMAEMLDPNTEASVDTIRKHRMHAEEIQRAVAVLKAAAPEDVTVDEAFGGKAGR